MGPFWAQGSRRVPEMKIKELFFFLWICITAAKNKIKVPIQFQYLVPGGRFALSCILLKSSNTRLKFDIIYMVCQYFDKSWLGCKRRQMAETLGMTFYECIFIKITIQQRVGRTIVTTWSQLLGRFTGTIEQPAVSQANNV